MSELEESLLNLSGKSLVDKGRSIVQSILGLPEDAMSKIPVNMALFGGLARLKNHEQNYPNIRFDYAQLKAFLIVYRDQELQSDEKEWFRQFVQRQKEALPQIYKQLLANMAKDRINVLGDDKCLSVTLRLLFDFNRPDALRFNRIRNSLVRRGLSALNTLRVYLHQPNSDQWDLNELSSPLGLALKGMIVHKLKKFIGPSTEINPRDELINQAAELIVLHGWNQGLEKSELKQKLSQDEFESLLQSMPILEDQDEFPPASPISTNLAPSSPLQAATNSHTEPAPTTWSPRPEPAPDRLYSRAESETVPSYSRPEPPPDRSYSRPEPAPDRLYSRAEPETAPSYSRPEPSPDRSYSRPEPSPVSSYSRPEPAPDRLYSRAEPETAPSYSRPEPSPVSSYSRPEPPPDRSNPRTRSSSETADNAPTTTAQNAPVQKRNGEVFQLSDLVSAGEMLYLRENSEEIIKRLVENWKSNGKTSNLVNDLTIPVMFLLKRYQNLDSFSEFLFARYGRDLVKPPIRLDSLRMFIDLLLSKSDSSLCRKLFFLLSRRNPVPLIEPSMRLMPDLIHVWNDTCPVLLSFGLADVLGKSSILNQIFLTSFEIHPRTSSDYFLQTIDIDFGYNTLPRRSVNIADAHGVMTVDLLKRIHRLFDGYLIHLRSKSLETNIDQLRQFLQLIGVDQKYCVLIVRYPGDEVPEQVERTIQGQFRRLKIKPLLDTRNASDSQLNYEIRMLTEEIFAKPPRKSHVNGASARDELLELIDPTSRNHLAEISRLVKPLKDDLLMIGERPELVRRFFPEYSDYVALCEIKATLATESFYESRDHARTHELHQRKAELEEALSKPRSRSSDIYRGFFDILQSAEMFSCLETLHTELREERKRLSKEILAQNLTIDKNLTLEVLWRNQIVCSASKPIAERQFIQERFRDYIHAGYPFELLDGDNFSFHYQFLSDVFQRLSNRRVCVISTIGPQNSGKSTLLNYMFGTLFDVQDCRCTRGIYGSLIQSKQSDFDDILVIDTEGLIGLERSDPEYDRRIVFFCLAMSHVVLVNMAGELSTTMENILQLCQESLSKMDTSRTKRAIIHLVFNQRLNLTVPHRLDAMQKMLSITNEQCHCLPSAFQTDQPKMDKPSFSRANTVPDFLTLVQSLVEKVLKSVKNVEKADPFQWLTSAAEVFGKIEKSADLTFYQDLHERNLDQDIRERIRQMVFAKFSMEYQETLRGKTANQNDDNVEKIFRNEQEQIQREMNRTLEEILTLLRASDRIRQRNEDYLQAQIYGMFNSLRVSISESNRREKVMKIFRDAEEQIRRFIDSRMQEEGPIGTGTPEQQFDECYRLVRSMIDREFNQEERFDQSMVNIHRNYEIFERKSSLTVDEFKRRCLDFRSFEERSQTMHELQETLIRYFTDLAYHGDPAVTANHFNPAENSVYSIDERRNYLNTYRLREIFPSQGGAPRSSSFIAFQTRVREEINDERPRRLDQSRYDDSRLFLPLSNIFRLLTERILQAMHGDNPRQPIRQVQTDLIQRIAGLVGSLILEVNDELNPFCLELSKEFQSLCHTIARIVLTKFYFDEQKTHFQRLLEEFERKKNEFKQLFVTKMAENGSLDKTSASLLLQALKDRWIQSLIQHAQIILRDEIQNRNEIDRKYIQDCIDGQLINQKDVQWYMNYVSNPTMMIEEFFKDLWNYIKRAINQKLEERKQMFLQILREFFLLMQQFSDCLRRFGSSDQWLDILFEADFTSGDLSMEKSRAMMELISAYVTGQQIPSTFQVNRIRLRLNDRVLNQLRTPNNRQLIQLLRPLADTISNLSLRNPSSFFQSLNNGQEKLFRDIERIPYDFDSVDQNDTYARLLDKVRGCLELCPCCRRPCDVDHTRTKSQPGSIDNQHQCQTGHNLRAMNGYKIESTDEPSLLMCEQIKDNQQLEVDQRRYLWSDFKKYFSNWNFDSNLNDSQLQQMHAKFLTVWREVGPAICRRYGMKYVSNLQSLTIQHQSNHYILLLDGSGSMAGKRWDNLLLAVQEFLQRRLALNTTDRVSILVFSDRVQKIYTNEEIAYVNIYAIEHLAGQTSFRLAFDEVYRCVKKHAKPNKPESPHSRFVIVFMSDGEADYPARELNGLLSNYRSIIKRFWTIALTDDESSSMDILRQINQTMGGSFMDIKKSFDLIQAYVEIASTPL